MAGEDPKAVVRRELEELYGAGNLEVADEIVAADFVGYDPALPEPIRGPAGVKDAVTGYRTAFPDLRLTIEAQFSEGDLVATRWKATDAPGRAVRHRRDRQAGDRDGNQHHAGLGRQDRRGLDELGHARPPAAAGRSTRADDGVRRAPPCAKGRHGGPSRFRRAQPGGAFCRG